MESLILLDRLDVFDPPVTFRELSPEKRNCFYEDELQLDFFPIYKSANCMLECAWLLAMETCQCVPWFLLDRFSDTSICEIYGNKCFADIVDNRYERYIPLQAHLP